MQNIVMVSVCCITFNHEKYIEQCIKGLVNQKTNFNYEIIIHDDASTDGTKKIIDKYATKYPELIKTIIQEENQYSKRKDILKEFIAPKISGKYVAICEGDDFWNNENKLQAQVDALENDADCNMCVHATREVFEDGSPTGIIYPNSLIQEGKIKSQKLYLLPYSFHTSSYFFRASKWLDYILSPPEFRKVCDVGDEPDLLYFGRNDGILYINQIMSSYRRGVAGSWSSTQAKILNIEKMAKHAETMLETFKLFDDYTDKFYHAVLMRKMANFKLQACTLQKRVKNFFRKDGKEYYANLSLGKKVFVIIAFFLPKTMQKWYANRLKRSYKKNGY